MRLGPLSLDPMSFGLKVAILAGVLGVVTALAKAAGATNLGTALGIGQIAFTLVLVALLLKR